MGFRDAHVRKMQDTGREISAALRTSGPESHEYARATARGGRLWQNASGAERDAHLMLSILDGDDDD